MCAVARPVHRTSDTHKSVKSHKPEIEMTKAYIHCASALNRRCGLRAAPSGSASRVTS